MKGIAYSTVVIVALLGVLMLSVWSYSQLSTGSRYVGTYTERTDEDIANSKLELAKKFLTQDLIYSSQEAALEIASNGGTLQSKTFWYCNGDPQPPSKQELLQALSTMTLDYLNAYVEGLKDSDIAELGISASKYSCSGIYSPDDTSCSQKDSKKCEYFRSTATGGMVKVTDPTTASYTGDMSSSNDNNRMMWMHKRLYDDTKDSKMFRVITSSLRDQCRGPQTMTQKLEVAFQKACEHLTTTVLDKDVECSYTVSCVDVENPIACLNLDCKRQEPEKLCFKSDQAASDKGLEDLLKNIGGKSVKAQATSASGVVIKFTLTDKKYNIATSKELKPLVFNVWAAFNIAPQQCRPID